MDLPKLYAPVKMKFSTLRSAGGHFDMDVDVIRTCRRVLCLDSWSNGWKWQIVNYYQDRNWDCTLEQDKEILDNYGSELEYELA